MITAYASDPAYQALINQEIGWTNVPIARNYNGDSLMGYFVNDAIYNDLNTDGTPANDVDMVFNNPGGLRGGHHLRCLPLQADLRHDVQHPAVRQPTAVGTMTGAQIMELLNQAASLNKGAIQPAGMRYKFYQLPSRHQPRTRSDLSAWSGARSMHA